MRTVAVIQARMGSTRLPGKVLADIHGLAMLWYVVRRVGLANRVNHLEVAVPDTLENQPLVTWCANRGVSWTAGPEHDVLTRYQLAAERTRADRIVRITADCPLIDPDLIDAAIDLANAGYAWASNVRERTFPDGLDVEVLTAETLRQLDVVTTDPADREHVTPALYRGAVGPGAGLRAGVPCADLRWTVDTQADLDWVRQLYARLPWYASWQRVRRTAEALSPGRPW